MSNSAEDKELLKKFCDAYLNWIDEGAIESGYDGFCRDAGICWNSGDFGLTSRIIHNAFEEGGITDFWYPFNVDGQDYVNECDSSTCHQNPLRLEWVRKHSSRSSE